MKPVAIISNPKEVFRISHTIFNTCNYTCNYCFPDCNTGTMPYFKDYKLMVKNLKHIFNQYTDKSVFDINITGGEPTLWPDLQDYCKEIKAEHNVMLSLQSNGSRTLRWWEENSHLFSKVLLSYHHKEADLEHFVAVADTCYRNTFVVVTVCMDPDNWDKCIDAIEYLKRNSKHKWYIRLQKLEGNFKYTPTQIEFLKQPVVRLPNLFHAFRHRHKFYNKESKVQFENGKILKINQHDISLNDWNVFTGWECNLGVDSMYIGPDGFIGGSCGQRLFDGTQNYSLYDPEFEKHFNPQITPTICSISKCICVPEINLTKKIIPLVRI